MVDPSIRTGHGGSEHPDVEPLERIEIVEGGPEFLFQLQEPRALGVGLVRTVRPEQGSLAVGVSGHRRDEGDREVSLQ